MKNDVKSVAQTVLSKLNEKRLEYPSFDPMVYIGKTECFKKAYSRHNDDGFPVFIRVAEGNQTNISELEDLLITMFKKDNNWKVANENKGSGGNVLADKLYICFNSSVEGDPLGDNEEEFFLGQGFPIKM